MRLPTSVGKALSGPGSSVYVSVGAPRHSEGVWDIGSGHTGGYQVVKSFRSASHRHADRWPLGLTPWVASSALWGKAQGIGAGWAWGWPGLGLAGDWVRPRARDWGWPHAWDCLRATQAAAVGLGSRQGGQAAAGRQAPRPLRGMRLVAPAPKYRDWRWSHGVSANFHNCS